MTDDSQGMIPGAPPTAPGGMSENALRNELANVHQTPLPEITAMTWPQLIDAVIAGRLAREKEAAPVLAVVPDPPEPERHLNAVPDMPAELHPFKRSAEGSGKVCMEDGCAESPDAAVHAPPWEEPTAETESTPGHTRTKYSDENGGHGPDYCLECSKHIHEWVQWPCTGQLPERCEKHQMAADVCPDCNEEKRKLAAQAAYVFQGSGTESTYDDHEAALRATAEANGECMHGLQADECALCLGIEAPEVMAVAMGVELIEQAPGLSIWTETLGIPPVAGPHSCRCDASTLELMGCVCGGTPALLSLPPVPELPVPAYVPPATLAGLPNPFAPPGASGADPFPPTPDGGSVAAPPQDIPPAAEGSQVAEQSTAADVAVRPFRKFSNSELRTYKRCRRKWYLTFYRGLSLRKQGVGPLSIGNMVHHPLEMYYGTPDRDPETFDWETPLAEHVEARLADPELPDHLHADMLADYELVKIMLRGYFAWIVEEGPDSELEVLEPEREIEAYLDVIEGTDVWIIGKLDVEAVLKSDGRRVFIDHKSVANLSDIPKTGLLDEQQRQYGLLQRLEAAARKAAGQPFAETFTRGGVWNMLRKVKRTATAKPPFYGRASVSHNDDVFRNFYKRVWGEARDILVTTRNLDNGGDHQVEVYPNPTRDCSWDCPFFTPGVCAMLDDGSDVESVISLEFTQYDPYARYTELEKG